MLSDWGVKEEELPLMVQNARDTMGSLFTLDPRPLTDEEVLQDLSEIFPINTGVRYKKKEECLFLLFLLSQF